MFQVNDLSFRYKGHRNFALRGVSFDCESGGFVAIVGRSGVGKSTLISLLAGIYNVTDSVVGDYHGQILVDGCNPDEIRGPSSISWVPQVPALLDHLTVIQNVLLPLSIGRRAEKSEEQATRLLAILGLRDHVASRPRELSGGMKTKVSLLRALISSPKYLYLDEPFVGLDLMNRWRIYKLLKELRHERHLTTILTTHNIPEAALLADRIILMREDMNRTDIIITPNEARLVEGAEGEVCMKTAREVAASIERQLFLAEDNNSLS